MHLLPTTAVFLNGLLAGTFVGSSLVEHAMRTLQRDAWIAYKQAKEVVFGAVMPAFLLLCIAMSAANVVPAAARWAFAGSVAMQLAILAITVVVHLPINRFIQSCVPGAPAPQWEAHRARWRGWNWLRCALAVAAFAISLWVPA